MVRSQTSTDSSVTSVSRDRNSESVRAALLWSTSRRPNRATVAATAPTTSSSEDRSTSRALADPPASSMLLATRTAPDWSMSMTTTEAPSRARARADACPIPPAPPVTMATLPATRPAVTGNHPGRGGLAVVVQWSSFSESSDPRVSDRDGAALEVPPRGPCVSCATWWPNVGQAPGWRTHAQSMTGVGSTTMSRSLTQSGTSSLLPIDPLGTARL